MKYYLICGERSGDLHASNLARAIRARDPEAQFRGVGGDALAEAGADIFIPFRELSFMGIVDVVLHLGRFRKAIRDVKKDIRDWKADAVIYVDFAAFNMRIAPFTKKHNIRSYYYISPKLWAWNTGRARKVKKYIDHMYVILPFEKQFYAGFDYPVEYVGNPVRDALKDFTPDPEFRRNLPTDGKVVALLPGSRTQEVRTSLPVFREVANRLPQYTFLIAAVRNLENTEYDLIRDLENVTILEERNYDVLAASEAALVTSGTATLETCLLRVPQAVVYRTSTLNWMIARQVMKVDYISLVNLIAGREVVKEYLQEPFTVENCMEELEALLHNEDYRSAMLSSYDEIEKRLGEDSPSDNTAERILEDLQAAI